MLLSARGELYRISGGSSGVVFLFAFFSVAALIIILMAAAVILELFSVMILELVDDLVHLGVREGVFSPAEVAYRLKIAFLVLLDIDHIVETERAET